MMGLYTFMPYLGAYLRTYLAILMTKSLLDLGTSFSFPTTVVIAAVVVLFALVLTIEEDDDAEVPAFPADGDDCEAVFEAVVPEGLFADAELLSLVAFWDEEEAFAAIDPPDLAAAAT